MTEQRLTVVETPEFIAQARHFWSNAERDLVVDVLSLNPKAGHRIPGTGGVRKLRWGIDGRGKSGGARVIYFYHNDMPLFLLSAYAKNRQEDLSQTDKSDF